MGSLDWHFNRCIGWYVSRYSIDTWLIHRLALCRGCLPVSPHGEFAPTEFAPTSTDLAIKCLKFIFLKPKKRQYCTHYETKHVYFSFFNPVKVTDELEIESLGWVHGGELGGGELTMGRNRYKPCRELIQVEHPPMPAHILIVILLIAYQQKHIGQIPVNYRWYTGQLLVLYQLLVEK